MPFKYGKCLPKLEYFRCWLGFRYHIRVQDIISGISQSYTVSFTHSQAEILYPMLSNHLPAIFRSRYNILSRPIPNHYKIVENCLLEQSGHIFKIYIKNWSTYSLKWLTRVKSAQIETSCWFWMQRNVFGCNFES